MKNRSLFLILIVPVMLLCIPMTATAADEINFPAGSLIIPMDSVYQGGQDATNDGGLLEAYGLIYYLLDHKDQSCIDDCEGDADCEEECENDIIIYWVINDQKTTIDGIDLVIDVDQATLDGYGVDAVAKLYDHNGGTSAITTYRPDQDSDLKISYLGAPFIIDGVDAAKAKTIINQSGWSAVDVHEIKVPFAAMVHRHMQGTPPKIALMNDDEDTTSGNAQILESYLSLAGICTDVYDILTPNDIRDGQLHTGGYDFLWAPHWTGYKNYDVDNNGNSILDVEDIVSQIKVFLENGNGLFAECASIEVFEHSPNGKFLSTKGFGHNGGTNDADTIIYNDPTAGNAQVGDFAYDPEGGHLHNWRPFHSGDDYNFDDLPDVSGGDSEYANTVSRFIIDDTGWDYYVGGYAYGDTRNGYVIYLGGHKYAECSDESVLSYAQPLLFEFNKDLTDEEFTLVVDYDSGSQTTVAFTTSDLTAQVGDPLEVDLTAASVNKKLLDNVILRNTGESSIDIDSISLCWTGGDGGQYVDTITNKYSDVVIYNFANLYDVHEMKFEFTENISTEVITLVVNYDSGSQTTVTFPPFDTNAGDPLLVDITSDGQIKDKKIEKIYFQNTGGSLIIIDSITVSWTGGVGGQLLKKFENKTTDIEIDDINQASPHTEVTGGFLIAPAGAAAALTGCQAGETGGEMEPPYLTTFSIDSGTAGVANCTDNANCSWKNMAGVQMVLNTLFNIKFQINSREYVRSSPIVVHPYLYQGTFEYPSYFGHFRRYDVTATEEDKDDEWDTGGAGKISGANNGNADGRKVYTAKYVDGTWTKITFDDSSIEDLRVPLDVNPGDGDDVDELAVITRLRGKDWDSDYDIWVERENKMGGIMHSAPVIVVQNSRTSVSESRTELAYMGDLYGMLHAIDITTGIEKWVFIPPNLLGKLQNDRTDPNAVQDFAGVDGSPTARDVFYDHDDDPDNAKQWRTILVCSEGLGGKHIFALDVTDPDNFSMLWEITDNEMGHAYRTAIGKVKSGEELKWMVFVATGAASIVDAHGGINIFAFDLKSGAKLWHFFNEYSDAVNDIPGSITLFDIDDDTFVDRVFVGDMNGRMWALKAVDGTNPYGTVQSGDDIGKQIPLWNAGLGNPISVSPAIMRVNPVILVFGTGGTDWAATNQHYYIYAVTTEERDDPENPPSYTGGAGTLYWDQIIELPLGQKVWSTPTIAAGNIYLATAIGTMESGSPRSDLASDGQDTGTLYSIKMEDGSENWSIDNIGKVRGSIFVDTEHAYLTTIDNEIIQVGGDTFPPGIVNNVVLRAWRQLNQ